MDQLKEHPQIVELLDTLDKNGLMKEKNEVQSLVSYIGGMEETLTEMLGELQDMRREINLIHNNTLRSKCHTLVEKTEGKIRQGFSAVKKMKDNLIQSAGNAVRAFRERGRDALAESVRAMKIPEALDKLSAMFGRMSKEMAQDTKKLSAMQTELQGAKGHLKNMGLLFMGKAAKEAEHSKSDKGVLSRLSRLFEKAQKGFASLEQKAMDTADKLRVSRVKSSVKENLSRYRAAAKAEKAAEKANVNYLYHKTLHENPQLTSNPLSRFMQKRQIKRQYVKAAKTGGTATAKKAAENTRKAAKKTAEETRQAAAFVARHPAGVCIAVAALLLFIMISAGLSSCGSMFSGLMNGIVGTSYTSEDSDLVATENNYAAKETELQQRIDNIERDNPGYDEYRYDLDNIGHNPHELASYLTALLQSYTPQSAQAELNRVFDKQYTLTLTEEIEVRYRTETRTDTWTDEDGNSHSDTYTVEVPYNYYILNVKLTNKPINSFVSELLTVEQLEMYRVYLETSGNKPLIFGGGSPDVSASEDLSGVQFVNGTRPGNTAIVDLAKRQVGNVGGQPYWSWYGFNSRVEWCACFVSWCYGQMGLSEPRFAACQSQGIPWFTSRGQWGARGYENIAPGDAIFFDWDLDGSADHVGLVIGTDGSRVYTVEGNSGDACKIKSYPLDYACIKGYGLMNWN